jgi:hypothetical protein
MTNVISSEEVTLARLSEREVELLTVFRKAEQAYQRVIFAFAAHIASEHPFYGRLPANVVPFRLK